MARWDGLRKTERDAEIRLFIRQHRSWSEFEVAQKFGMSRSNISRIKNAGRRKGESK